MELVWRVLAALTTLHPPHGMTVHFPVAFSALAVLLLAIAWWKRDACLERAAFFVIGLTAIATVVAGLVGMRDNAVRYDGEAPYVPIKIGLALALLVVSLVLWLIRRGQNGPSWSAITMTPYLVAFGVCFALAATLAFLGGAIVWGF